MATPPLLSWKCARLWSAQIEKDEKKPANLISRAFLMVPAVLGNGARF
jgi:hypothetical protein